MGVLRPQTLGRGLSGQGVSARVVSAVFAGGGAKQPTTMSSTPDPLRCGSHLRPGFDRRTRPGHTVTNYTAELLGGTVCANRSIFDLAVPIAMGVSIVIAVALLFAVYIGT